MLDPSILSSVHAVEPPFPRRIRDPMWQSALLYHVQSKGCARSGSAVIRVSSRHLSCAELLHCS